MKQKNNLNSLTESTWLRIRVDSFFKVPESPESVTYIFTIASQSIVEIVAANNMHSGSIRAYVCGISTLLFHRTDTL